MASTVQKPPSTDSHDHDRLEASVKNEVLIDDCAPVSTSDTKTDDPIGLCGEIEMKHGQGKLKDTVKDHERIIVDEQDVSKVCLNAEGYGDFEECPTHEKNSKDDYKKTKNEPTSSRNFEDIVRIAYAEGIPGYSSRNAATLGHPFVDSSTLVSSTNVVRVPKKKDHKWLATFEELNAYKREKGSCVVPRGYGPNPRLASWVAEQRKQYKLMQKGRPSSITQERVDLLEELGFAWNAQEAAWSRHMEDLKTFRQQTGHCHVPLDHAAFPKLGLWVKEQRRHYTLMNQGKQSHMTQHRIDKLNKINFTWDTHQAIWLERLEELADFKARMGHCSVPINYSANSKLATWVHHQRRQYKKFKDGKACHITKNRINQLDALGFNWTPRDEKSSEETSPLSQVDNTTQLEESHPAKRRCVEERATS